MIANYTFRKEEYASPFCALFVKSIIILSGEEPMETDDASKPTSGDANTQDKVSSLDSIMTYLDHGQQK